MFERFTRDARGVVMAAVGEAERRGDRHVGTEHLLLGLIASPDLITCATAADHSLELHRARRTLDDADSEALSAVGINVDEIPGDDGRVARRTRRLPRSPLTDGAKHTLEAALREALAHRDRHIRPAHVLLALCAQRQPDPGLSLLASLGVAPAAVRSSLERRLSAAA